MASSEGNMSIDIIQMRCPLAMTLRRTRRPAWALIA
jgi:hypothetical protein